MEPDDPLCSGNERSEKALVERTQWEIKQDTLPCTENTKAWKDPLTCTVGDHPDQLRKSRMTSCSITRLADFWDFF
jgi:hypothetical protein